MDPQLPICGEDIKDIAKNKWDVIHPTNKNQFKNSQGWCDNFKNRWNLSSRKIQISRIASQVPTEDEIIAFTDEYEKLHDEVGPDNFYNMDETTWRSINASATTVRPRGSGPAKISTPNNEKEGCSVAITASAAGILLKPVVIAKGKTNRALIKFKLADNFIGAYSNNGWMNNGIMKLIIDHIFSKSNNKKSVLLIDKHPSHTSDFIKEYASAKNIYIFYVPVGMTSKYQPLDLKVNGILKSVARKLWRAGN